MSSTASWRTFASAFLLGHAFLGMAGCAGLPEPRTVLDGNGLALGTNWIVEAEQPSSSVRFSKSELDIDTPAGCTLWFRPRLDSAVEIQFDAMAVKEGGPNDQVSDLNVFWMASNRDGSAPFSTPRSGKFADYNDLLTYYVGLGGNRNTTTRFRRYIGDPALRPLLPEHDLAGRKNLLVANHWQTITLIAQGGRIEYQRNGRTLFRIDDPQPYVHGWFALRTTYSHLRIKRLRIYTLSPASNSR